MWLTENGERGTAQKEKRKRKKKGSRKEGATRQTLKNKIKEK